MILDALFEGRIYPAENVFPKSDEYKAIMNKAEMIIEELQKNKSSEDWDKLEKFYSLMLESQNMFSREQFKYGFTIGMLLMKEMYDLRK